MQFCSLKTRRLILASSNLVILILVLSQTINAGYGSIGLKPGTIVGDSVSYTVTTSDMGLHDPVVARFANVSAIDLTTINVSGLEITLSQIWKFTNRTDDRSFVLTGNVATGQGNYSSAGVQWFIGGGLKAGDILQFSFDAVKVNSTIPNISYAGKLVTVNTWNVSSSGPGQSETESHVWEQHSGLLMERMYHVSYGGLDAVLEIKAVQVNIQYPDFKLSVSQSTVNATTNSEASSTIRVESLNSFGGTIGFAVDPAPGLFCTMNPTSLNITTSASSTLTCHASTAKSYTATVNATSGTIFHSVTVTYEYTGSTLHAAQENTGLAPVLLYTLVGVVIAAGLAGFALFRWRRLGKDLPLTSKPAKHATKSG